MSQNPPIRDLMSSLPDEIWVIQVNPTSVDYEPTTVAEIANRRNELAGNLALLQELNSMEVFDDLIDRGELKSDRLRPVTIRLLEMRRPPGTGRLGATSKLNRDPLFIRELISHGKEQAADFMASIRFETLWRTRDVNGMTHYFADDATIFADVPECRVDRTNRPADVHRFVTEQLLQAARIDLTRKRVFRDSVAWDVRIPGGLPHHRGLAKATFRNGRVIDFTLTTSVL
jgi:NTE family protein